MLSWLIIALLAQFLAGSSAVIDKFFLKKIYPNPAGYAFWLGASSILSLVLIPFGTHLLAAKELILALIAGALFLVAILLFFMVLFRDEASNTVILIGSLSPIFTLLFGVIYLHNALAIYQLIGFAILISGGIFLFLIEKKEMRGTIFILALFSALCFAASNILSKYIFLRTDFFTGFMWIKLGEFLLALSLLLIPRWRSEIAHAKRAATAKNSLTYAINRGYAALSSVLISYAIFLGHPALVDATSNFKYVFTFIGAWIVLGERPKEQELAKRAAVFIILASGVFWLAAGDYLTTATPSVNQPALRAYKELIESWK